MGIIFVYFVYTTIAVYDNVRPCNDFKTEFELQTQ